MNAQKTLLAIGVGTDHVMRAPVPLSGLVQWGQRRAGQQRILVFVELANRWQQAAEIPSSWIFRSQPTPTVCASGAASESKKPAALRRMKVSAGMTIGANQSLCALREGAPLRAVQSHRSQGRTWRRAMYLVVEESCERWRWWMAKNRP
jgi:hypothetical protein